MTKKTRTYGWAVVNRETGRVMRESNDRRAYFATRSLARAAALNMGENARVVRRNEVTETPRATLTTKPIFGAGFNPGVWF